MPSAPDILSGLSAIANQWRYAAIAWHVVLAVAMLAVLAGRRPSTRAAAYALISPLLFVAIAAFAFGNVMNGTVFATLSLGLGAIARHLSREPIRPPSPAIAMAAALFVAVGWAYPHFLQTRHWMEYTYAAPFGLLPCPTLALVTGVSIACDQFGSRAWTFTLGAAGLFYGAFGVFVLGVTLDYFLLAGAVTAVVTLATSLPQQLSGGAT